MMDSLLIWLLGTISGEVQTAENLANRNHAIEARVYQFELRERELMQTDIVEVSDQKEMTESIDTYLNLNKGNPNQNLAWLNSFERLDGDDSSLETQAFNGLRLKGIIQSSAESLAFIEKDGQDAVYSRGSFLTRYVKVKSISAQTVTLAGLDEKGRETHLTTLRLTN